MKKNSLPEISPFVSLMNIQVIRTFTFEMCIGGEREIVKICILVVNCIENNFEKMQVKTLVF